MLLVANVIDHTDVPAIAREDEITRGGGETATQFGPLSRFAVAPSIVPSSIVVLLVIRAVPAEKEDVWKHSSGISPNLVLSLLKTR